MILLSCFILMVMSTSTSRMQLALTCCGKQPAGLVAVMLADTLHSARVQGDGQNSSAAAPLGRHQQSVFICSSIGLLSQELVSAAKTVLKMRHQQED